MDVLQLVNSHTHAYLLKKGLSNIEEFSPESFEAKYEIPAEKFLDYKALAGDSSDNIPGVPGIGGKQPLSYLNPTRILTIFMQTLILLKTVLKINLKPAKTWPI